MCRKTHGHNCVKNTHTTMPIQHPRLDQVKQPHTQTRQNVFFTPDAEEYITIPYLWINNPTLEIQTHLRILCFVINPKLIYKKHIDNTAVKSSNTTNIWPCSKSSLRLSRTNPTYKAVTRQILYLHYMVTYYINNMVTIRNNLYKTIKQSTTHCNRLHTNIQHLFDEINIQPLNTHLKFHVSQIRDTSPHPTPPLHSLTKHSTHRQNQTAFNNYKCTTHVKAHTNVTLAHIKQNMKCIHPTTVTKYLITRTIKKLIPRNYSTFNQHIKSITNITTAS